MWSLSSASLQSWGCFLAPQLSLETSIQSLTTSHGFKFGVDKLDVFRSGEKIQSGVFYLMSVLKCQSEVKMHLKMKEDKSCVFGGCFL